MIPAGLMYVSLINNLGEKKAFFFALATAIGVGVTVWAVLGHALGMHFARATLASNVVVKASNEESENLYAAMRFSKSAVWRDELSSESNVFRSENAYAMAAGQTSRGIG
jgi:hypothetical protein